MGGEAEQTGVSNSLDVRAKESGFHQVGGRKSEACFWWDKDVNRPVFWNGKPGSQRQEVGTPV